MYSTLHFTFYWKKDENESNLSLVAMETEIKGSILEIIDSVVETFKQIETLNDRR